MYVFPLTAVSNEVTEFVPEALSKLVVAPPVPTVPVLPEPVAAKPILPVAPVLPVALVVLVLAVALVVAEAVPVVVALPVVAMFIVSTARLAAAIILRFMIASGVQKLAYVSGRLVSGRR